MLHILHAFYKFCIYYIYCKSLYALCTLYKSYTLRKHLWEFHKPSRWNMKFIPNYFILYLCICIYERACVRIHCIRISEIVFWSECKIYCSQCPVFSLHTFRCPGGKAPFECWLGSRASFECGFQYRRAQQRVECRSDFILCFMVYLYILI